MTIITRLKIGFISVILISFLLYLKTMARGFSYLNFGWDGGDLLAAASTFGLSRAPGFPLYIIISGLLLLLPFEPAFLTNLLSATMASLTVGFVFLIAFGLTKKFYLSLASSFLLAFSRIFWSQAIITEVSTMNAFFIGLIIFLALRFLEEEKLPKKRRLFYLTFLVLGLGISVHLTIFLMFPALFYLWFKSKKDILKDKCFWFKALSFFLLGLTPYLYIPVRAFAHPFVNWGEITHLKDFITYLSGQEYHQVFFSTSLREKIFAFFQTIGVLISSFNLATIGAVVAFYSLFFRRAKKLIFLSLLFLVYLLFNVSYFNITSFQAYLIPNLLFLSIIIALGFKFLFDDAYWNLSEKLSIFKNRLLYLSLALAILVQLYSNFQAVDVSGDFTAENLGKTVFEDLEKNAVIILGLESDERNFTLRYYQTVKAKRFDVLLLPPLFAQSRPHFKEFKRHHSQFNWEGIELVKTEEKSEKQVVKFIENNKEKYPIYLFHEDPYREGKYVAWQGYNFYTTNKPIYKLIF